MRTEHDALRRILTIALETPSSLADVFVYYSAHTKGVNVSIHDGGYKSTGTTDEASPQLSLECYLQPNAYLLDMNIHALLFNVEAHLAKLQEAAK